jgi:alkylation response protein AidB-like acyl-CoA dehydrogenase
LPKTRACRPISRLTLWFRPPPLCGRSSAAIATEIEREQRLPKALVEQFHAAGFYRLVRPRELGGLQTDPLTYLRVVELLAEGAGAVGWNLCNNQIAQLVTLGLPDEGIREDLRARRRHRRRRHRRAGGGRAVPVDGGYRVTGRWPFGTGCQESAWMLGSFQILDGDQPRRSPDGTSVYWRGVFARSEAQIVEGSWDVSGLRATGSFDWTVDDVFLPERRTMVHAGVPLDNQWSHWPGSLVRVARPGVGRSPPQRRDHRHRPARASTR